MSIDVTTPVSRRDRGERSSGAELALLLNRFEALTAHVADLVLEVRGWRADQARRRSGTAEQNGRDELLAMLVFRIMGDKEVFLAAEVLKRATKHPQLQHALTAAGVSTCKKLGRLFARLAQREIEDGVHLIRLGGTDRRGVLWRFVRL